MSNEEREALLKKATKPVISVPCVMRETKVPESTITVSKLEIDNRR